MLATPEQAAMFQDLDALLRDVMETEPAKQILKFGGAIRLRWIGDHVDIHYDGGIFEMCQKRIEKDKKDAAKR